LGHFNGSVGVKANKLDAGRFKIVVEIQIIKIRRQTGALNSRGIIFSEIIFGFLVLRKRRPSGSRLLLD
jgi:hypothetical protein